MCSLSHLIIPFLIKVFFQLVFLNESNLIKEENDSEDEGTVCKLIEQITGYQLPLLRLVKVKLISLSFFSLLFYSFSRLSFSFPLSFS